MTKTAEEIQLSHLDWITACRDVEQREQRLYDDLVEFYDLKKGDVVRLRDGRVFALVSFELRDRCGKWHTGSENAVRGMPMLICKGIKVTKKMELHSRLHEDGFNTSHEFEKIGTCAVNDWGTLRNEITFLENVH